MYIFFSLDTCLASLVIVMGLFPKGYEAASDYDNDYGASYDPVSIDGLAGFDYAY